MLEFNQPDFNTRTYLSTAVHGMSPSVEFAGRVWQKINANINWVETQHSLWASIGSTKKREHILFDQNSKNIQGLKNFAIEKCQPHKGNIDKILTIVNKIAKMLMFSEDISLEEIERTVDERLHAFVARKRVLSESNSAPYIIIDELIKNRILVCRHKAIIVAFLLSEIVKAGILPPGTVRQYRSNIDGGAHSWAVYRDCTKNELWICDPRWEYVANVTSSFEEVANEGYGHHAITKMISRLDHIETERLENIKRLARLLQPLDDSDSDSSQDEFKDNVVSAQLKWLQMRNREPIRPVAMPSIDLEFLTDNIQQKYDDLQRTHGFMNRQFRKLGKLMSDKGEHRFVTMVRLQALFDYLKTDTIIKSTDKIMIVYAFVHSIQLDMQEEQNKYRSNLFNLCQTYKYQCSRLLAKKPKQLFTLLDLGDSGNVEYPVYLDKANSIIRGDVERPTCSPY